MPEPKLVRLANEYRPTMHPAVLQAWAQDIVEAIKSLGLREESHRVLQGVDGNYRSLLVMKGYPEPDGAVDGHRYVTEWVPDA